MAKRVDRKDRRVTAADVCRFIETCLYVPEGRCVGEPLLLQSWQKDFIKLFTTTSTAPEGQSSARRESRERPRCRRRFCSLTWSVRPARNRPNSQLFSAAQSRDQAGLIFNLAAKMVRMSRDLQQAVTIKETAKELHCAELGTRYKALSADATTAFGLSPGAYYFR